MKLVYYVIMKLYLAIFVSLDVVYVYTFYYSFLIIENIIKGYNFRNRKLNSIHDRPLFKGAATSPILKLTKFKLHF